MCEYWFVVLSNRQGKMAYWKVRESILIESYLSQRDMNLTVYTNRQEKIKLWGRKVAPCCIFDLTFSRIYLMEVILNLEDYGQNVVIKWSEELTPSIKRYWAHRGVSRAFLKTLGSSSRGERSRPVQVRSESLMVLVLCLVILSFLFLGRCICLYYFNVLPKRSHSTTRLFFGRLLHDT